MNQHSNYGGSDQNRGSSGQGTHDAGSEARYGQSGSSQASSGWQERSGGSNQDIPQMNPVNRFDLLQVDLGVKF